MNEQLQALMAALLTGQAGQSVSSTPAAATVAIKAPIFAFQRKDGTTQFRMGDCEVARVTGGPVKMRAHGAARVSTVLYTAQATLSAAGRARVVGAAAPTTEEYVPGASGSSIAIEDADAPVDAPIAPADEPPLA